ncbi:hypothetical protein CsSME_00007464 [Camellia sinensis var. sinensis]
MWASILLPREFFIGTLNPRAYKCTSKVYSPSQFARQFGLTQGIPIPLFSLSNIHLTTRDLKVPKSKLEKATVKLLSDLSEFEFTPFLPSGSVLKRFQNWWTINMEVHLAIHSHDLLIGLGVPSKVKPKEIGTISSPSAATKATPAVSPPPSRVTRTTSKKEFESQNTEKEIEQEQEIPLQRKKRKKITVSPSDMVEDPTHGAAAKTVEKEHSKEIIVFQRAEKRRQQQLLRDEAVATDITQRELARRQHTAEHYSLHSSPIIATTFENSNFLLCLYFPFSNS